MIRGLLALAVAVPLHPLGNFTVNDYAGLRVGVTATTVDVVVDRAEIPTYQARADVARLGNTAYASRECAGVRDGATLTVGATRVTLSVSSANVEFPAGQAGLPTTRVTCTLAATYASLRTSTDVTWTAAYDRDRIGWHEVTAVGDRTTVVRSDVATASRSNRLTAYPADLLRSPLDQRAAHLTVEPGGAAATTETGLRSGGVLPRGVDAATAAFQRVVAREHVTVGFALVALLLSVALGAIHALAPGHGKTVMAAYLVGERGSPRQALVVGATVTATHTAGVLVLGIALSASSVLAPDRLFPWLGVASGLMLASIGVTLLRRARHERAHHHHDHSHDHDHAPIRTRGLMALGFAGGLVPSPSALVVLLGAIALHRAWFGVVLVVAYGIGMALTLTAAGLLLVRARRTLDRRTPRLDRVLPLVTASVVVVVGMTLAARGALVIVGG